jgi:MFS family permease
MYDACVDQIMKEKISPHAFKGEKGAWDGAPPFKFSLSMNFIMSVAMAAQAAGSLIFGRMCDVIGCKIPMQICLFMGIFGYVIIYAAGIWVHSYYLFGLGIVWNNFFGNTATVAQVYVGQLFDGEERDRWIGAVMAMLMVGASIGGIVTLPFVLNPENGENYFDSMWLALGVTVFALLLVTFILVPPEKKEKEVVEEKTPPHAKKILIIACIASALDSGGDEGTRMARGTIMTVLYPAWQTVSKQTYLLLSLIGVAMVTTGLLEGMKKAGLSLSAIAVIGCTFTLATQLTLMADFVAPPNPEGAYITIWHCGKLFGFLSTFASAYIIQDIAPKKLLGYWSGRNDALTNLAQAVTPLIFSNVYDGFGDRQGREMLACTGAVSFLAICAYLPLLKIMPKKKKEEESMKEESLEFYQKMSDAEWSQQPLEIVDKVTTKLVEAGQKPRMISWGSYHDERTALSGMRDRAMKDFKYIKNIMLSMLTNREEMLKLQKQQNEMDKMIENSNDMKELRNKAKKEMGEWIADYFDDAGYQNWETYAQLYKVMLMAAFPPIDALDEAKPDYGAMPVEQLEDNLVKWLGVFDMHLAIEEERIRPKIGVGAVMNLVKRR